MKGKVVDAAQSSGSCSAVRLSVIVSPRSGRKRARKLALAKRFGAFADVYVTSALDELRDALRRAREAGTDTIAILGGDGTNHLVLTESLRTFGEDALPRFVFLRGGTMNTVANSIGVARASSETLFERLLRARDRGETGPESWRRVMRVGDEVGFLFGVGAVHGFLAEYYGTGSPSPLTAASTLLRGAASAMVGGDTVRRMARPFAGRVVFDDHRWEPREYTAVTAGTVDQIGLGFRPFYRMRACPSAFQVLGIFAEPFDFVRGLVNVRRALPMGLDRAHERLATKMTLEPIQPDAPIEYMLDGDLRSAPAPLSVTLGPMVRILTC